MKTVEAYLTRKVQAFWPGAVVYSSSELVEVEWSASPARVSPVTGQKMYWLERADGSAIGLGMTFGQAKEAIGALKRQEGLKREGA